MFELRPSDAGAVDGLLDAAAYQRPAGLSRPSTTRGSATAGPRTGYRLRASRARGAGPMTRAARTDEPSGASLTTSGHRLPGADPAEHRHRGRHRARAPTSGRTPASRRRARPHRRGPGDGRRPARRARRCSWCGAVRTRAPGSCSTPTHHGGPAPGQRHLPGRRDGVPQARGVRPRPPTGSASATSAASTARTSTATRIERGPLHTGDEVQIGKYRFVFHRGSVRPARAAT